MTSYFDTPLDQWPPTNPTLAPGARYWVIYGRISHDPDNTFEGVRRQVIQSEQKIRETGYTGPILLRLDNDIPAFGRKQRPAFRQMLTEDMPSGRCLGIAAFHVDRLYRDSEHLQLLIKAHEANPLLILTVRSGDLDLNSETGRLVARLMASVAQYEVEQVRARLRSYHLQAAADGKPNGKPGFGYCLGMVINEPEADIIRWAVEHFLQGDTLESLARRLNDAGFRTQDAGRERRKKGSEETFVISGLWNASNLGKFLARPRLAGIRMHKGNVAKRDAWPAIISEIDHYRILAVLASPERRKFARGRERRYIGTGLVICGRCLKERGVEVKMQGTNVHGPKGRGVVGTKYICYRRDGGCNGCSRDAEKTDLAIVTNFLVGMSTGAHLNRQAPVTEEIDYAALAARLDEVREQISELAHARFTARSINAEVHTQLSAPLVAEEAEIQALLARPAQESPGVEGDDEDQFLAKTPQEKHEIIRKYVKHIVIHPATRKGAPFDPELIELVWA